MKSKIGDIYLVASVRGLSGILWSRQPTAMSESLEGDDPTLAILKRTVVQLEEYFRGERREFDLPLDIEGTEFQKQVWRQLARIPYGQTCSYSDIARRLKRDKAVRAVGTANGRNLLSIVVPCHRVIAADGTLGGYSGGLPVKRELLALERAT